MPPRSKPKKRTSTAKGGTVKSRFSAMYSDRRSGAKYPGVYFLSQDKKEAKDPEVLVKIGTTSNLPNRLDNYLGYFIRGFELHGWIETKTPAKLERRIHSYLTTKNRAVQQYAEKRGQNRHGHMTEWFLLTFKEVQQLIKDFAQLPASKTKRYYTGVHRVKGYTERQTRKIRLVTAMSADEKKALDASFVARAPVSSGTRSASRKGYRGKKPLSTAKAKKTKSYTANLRDG